MSSRFNPDRLRAGVDQVFAAMAEAKAVKDGADPMDAADIAEGETAVRRAVLANPCPHCKADAQSPCVRVGTKLDSRVELPGYHPSRTDLAYKAMTS